MDAPDHVLAAVTDALACERAAPRLSVAYSGGMDSTVLLEAVCRVAPQLGFSSLRALHVNHGLQPEAAAWDAHATRWCEARGINLEQLSVAVPRDARCGLEASAREARYAALAGTLEAGEILCVAHHSNDQAETVLLNLLRGAGSLGTGAMRMRRLLAPGVLLRPLLGLERSLLAECARVWALTWVSDATNERLEHPRNRLRHQVLPIMRAINPSAVDAICRSAELNQESADGAQVLAERDLRDCEEPGTGGLSRDALSALSSARRRAVLRIWCRREGVPVPGRGYLAEIERQIANGRRDRMPTFHLGQLQLTVHGGRLQMINARCAIDEPGSEMSWVPGTEISVSGGVLRAERTIGAGLREGAPLTVRFRAGGERCRPSGRRRSQTLKRLFQEYQVPPWQRTELPLLYRDGHLVAAAGLFVCHGHEASSGEPGWKIRWQPAEAARIPLTPD